jgi:nucleoside-diphosphate-sugar epimerase
MRILITGGTGFFGKHLIDLLSNSNYDILCYGRSRDKINKIFGDSITAVDTLNIDFDYLIHAACPTASSELANKSVETIDTIYTLTKSALEAAKRNNARMLFLSSMEVYGKIDCIVDEEDLGTIDLSLPRSGYAEGKRLAELLCNSYRSEYGTDVVIARLSQLFGPGSEKNDQRFFNYALRCLAKNENIKLSTDGTNYHNSIYVEDAAKLCLSLLFSNLSGTYNITNPANTMSITDLCNKMIECVGSDKKIEYKISDTTKFRANSKCIISNKKILDAFPDFHYTSFEKSITAAYDYIKRSLADS